MHLHRKLSEYRPGTIQFHRIDQKDGYVLSQVRDDANPVIVDSQQPLPGRSINLAGRKLDEVLDRACRETIGVTVELEVTLRTYRGRCSHTRRTFRMVGLRDKESGEFRL